MLLSANNIRQAVKGAPRPSAWLSQTAQTHIYQSRGMTAKAFRALPPFSMFVSVSISFSHFVISSSRTGISNLVRFLSSMAYDFTPPSMRARYAFCSFSSADFLNASQDLISIFVMVPPITSYLSRYPVSASALRPSSVLQPVFLHSGHEGCGACSRLRRGLH